MRSVIAVVGVGAVIFGGYLVAEWARAPTVVPKNNTIVAFGDSLVAGVGAPAGSSFVAQLSEMLGKPISNRGASGDTTRDALTRLDAVLLVDPGVAIVLFGGNDYLRKVPRSETEHNLGQIITELKRNGTVVVLLGVRGGILRDNFSDMYERLAEEHGTLYVPDVLDGLITNPELMHDAIHPNADGYAIIAARIAEVFTEQVQWQE